MNDELDATELAAMVRRGDASARELVDAAIARAERRNPAINAIIHPRYDKARRDADAVAHGPLAGVPIVIKDASLTEAGEPFHEGLQVAKDAGHRATSTSWLLERLTRAGCVVIGRTNVPELCTHTTTEPLAHGPTRNPWSLAHSAGGSSGGTGAAVAAGITPIGHGSDGGGSIRAPASFCGLVGLKPTRGRFTTGPDSGEHWAGLSTDGFLTRTVRDAAAVFDAVAGNASGDPYATPLLRPLAEALREPLGPLRIGVRTSGACGGDPAHPEVETIVRRVAALFERAGHHVDGSSPAALDELDAIAHQGTVVSVCVANDVAAWSRRLGREITLDELEPRNRSSVTNGRSVDGVAYVAAQAWLHGWSRRLCSWFDDHDLLLTPTITRPPLRIGELPVAPTAGDMAAMRRSLGWLLGPWNVTGQPAVSVPGGFTPGGLPIGVHLVAGWGREDLLLQAARFLEEANPWPGARDPSGPDPALPVGR